MGSVGSVVKGFALQAEGITGFGIRIPLIEEPSPHSRCLIPCEEYDMLRARVFPGSSSVGFLSEACVTGGSSIGRPSQPPSPPTPRPPPLPRPPPPLLPPPPHRTSTKLQSHRGERRCGLLMPLHHRSCAGTSCKACACCGGSLKCTGGT